MTFLEPTDLPGSGYRCADHVNCRRRVRAIRETANWPDDEPDTEQPWQPGRSSPKGK